MFQGFDLAEVKADKVESIRNKLVEQIRAASSEVEAEAAKIEQALRNAIDSLPEGQLKTDLQNQLADLRSQVDEGAISWEQYKMKLQEVQDHLDRTGQRMTNVSTKFNKISKNFGSLTSAVTASYAAMNGMNNLIYSLSSGTANFGSILGSLISIFPMVATGIKLVGEAMKTAERSSIILAAVSVALGAVMTIIGAIQGADKAERERNEKATTATNEKYIQRGEQLNQEVDDSTALIKNYNDLYETYLETGEGQDQLAESARALAEAYGLVGANVLIAQGNFEEFNELLAKSLNFNKQINALE